MRLSYDLHKLTSRLDRAADELLRGQEGVSYSRFLTLFAARETGATQRELAEWLGQSEPSTSRMVGVLTEDGLLIATRTPGNGNRRRLELTDAGARLVDRCGSALEDEFAELVARSGVPYTAYHRHTLKLLTQLEAGRAAASARATAR